MRRLSRRFKRHFNKPTKRVAIKSHRAWYWQVLAALILVSMGYALAYWHFTVGGKLSPPFVSKPELTDQELLAKVVFAERQLQVQQAAQENLARELASVQEESIKLKENVAFYQSILEENSGGDRVRMNQVKLEKGKSPAEYDYHLVLSQQGAHSKSVQGDVKFALHGSNQEGQEFIIPLKVEQAKVNFRYYQRLSGSFSLPQDVVVEAIEVSFLESGAKQPNISQKVDLPE
ncbi:hypothetical protein LG198_09940 [Methylobacillus arboreus]|uniref:DUF6776 family protein n=1 Tax=Methylobacillus arboreus TaxID=755170 RepID=UPI001E30BED1|nr:DUF6776 family protein [Methylobacillus arboreus]MCB5191047.1 hypothetical protein [Methylobacillus arboreus]